MKRSRHLFIIAGVLMLLLPGSILAQSYFNALFMGQFGSLQGQDMALGNANSSAFSNGLNTFGNPANQGEFQGLQVSGNFAYLSMNENRSYPAIDQFGDRVTDNIYVISRGGQNGLSGSATWGNGQFAVTAASMPVLTPAFFYKEELRGSLYSPNINRDPLIGYHHVEQRGVIQGTGVSGAASFGGWSLGLGLRMLHGMGLESSFGVSVLDSTDISSLASGTTLLEEEAWELSNTPVIMNLGLIKDLNMHWRVSASFQGAYTLESDRQGAVPVFKATDDLPHLNWVSDTVGVAVEVPARMEFGLRMKPSNPLPTAVYVSLAYQDWTGYSVSYSDSLGGELSGFDYPMQEALTISGGIEHWISDNVPFRAGFVWTDSPLAGELAQTRFSAGSGWRSGPFQFDFAIQLSAVEYSFTDLFVPVGLTGNATETVHENQTQYVFSVSYDL